MELTAEQFAEIVVAVGPVSHHEQGGDKRGAQRSERHASVVITVVGAGTPPHAHTVTVRNVSSKGVAILLNQWLPRGDQFVMRLKGREGRVTSLLCNVAHCRRINANLFLVGAEFGRVLAEDESHPATTERPPGDAVTVG